MQSTPNPEEREPVTLKTHPPLSTNGSIPDYPSTANPCRGDVCAATWWEPLIFGLVSQTALAAAQPVALGFRGAPCAAGFDLILHVIEDLLDHHRAFDAGVDFHGATAVTACLDIDVENTLQALCPGHRRSPFGRRSRLIGTPVLVAPAPL